MAQQILSTNTFTTARWIVSPTQSDGTHTTIAAALTSASSGDTIFIRPGTYTENITLKAGVNLTAYDADATTPNVTILGTCTFSLVGTVSLSGINLKTNSANCLVVGGSAATILYLINCNIDANNNTAISFTTSNTAAELNLVYCSGTIDTTGIALHTMSSTGNLRYRWCSFRNPGASVTASSISAGAVLLQNSTFNNAFSTSSTGQIVSNYTTIDVSAINTTAITTAGSGASNTINYGSIQSGTASALSIGSGTTLSVYGARLDSSNTNAITGAGTAIITDVVFSGTSNKSNVTTQTGGVISGLTQGTAPSAGFIGEQIRSFIGQGSAVGLSTTVAKTVTSISLTPGIWDVSILAQYVAGATTIPTLYQISVSPTANTNPSVYGDSDAFLNNNAGGALSTGLQPTLSVPSFRVTLSATTTYYFCAVCSFTISTMSVYGRISATRVG